MTATTAGLASAPYDDLATALRGDLIRPGDTGYDQARAVYNGMIDKHPAAIARVRDVADVITCVRFGREHGLDLAVRGGGHNAAGLASPTAPWSSTCRCCAAPRSARRDHTVRVDAGCTWGDVDHATVALGMATPSGFLATTGVAGLTLGGGDRLPHPAVRADRGQPAVRGRGAGRRLLRDRERDLAPGPVLGAARRRRQLRRGDLVHLPHPRHRRKRDHHRRPGAVRPGRRRPRSCAGTATCCRPCPRS